MRCHLAPFSTNLGNVLAMLSCPKTPEVTELTDRLFKPPRGHESGLNARHGDTGTRAHGGMVVGLGSVAQEDVRLQARERALGGFQPRTPRLQPLGLRVGTGPSSRSFQPLLLPTPACRT